MIRRLRISLTITAATVALATVLAGPVAAQGVPTVDTQNIAQEIRQQQQMLEDIGIQSDIFENALEQLDMLQQQFDQLQSMYASLTGPREILGLLMGGELDQLLEAKFEDIPGLIRASSRATGAICSGSLRGRCAPRCSRRWRARVSTRIPFVRSPPAGAPGPRA